MQREEVKGEEMEIMNGSITIFQFETLSGRNQKEQGNPATFSGQNGNTVYPYLKR